MFKVGGQNRQECINAAHQTLGSAVCEGSLRTVKYVTRRSLLDICSLPHLLLKMFKKICTLSLTDHPKGEKGFLCIEKKDVRAAEHKTS